MKNSRVPLVGLLLFLFSVTTGWGQEDNPSALQEVPVRRISLAEAVGIARADNFDIRISRYEHDEASADFHKSASVFLPRISLTESFVSTDDPLTTFGLKLKQEKITPADFDPALLNNPPQFRNFTTKVEVLQPVLNFDGFYGRHAASRAADAAGAKLVRTRFGVELGVKNAYYGLVLANKSLDVITEAIRAASAYRDQARDFRDAGMIQESDYLMAETHVVGLEMERIESENSARDAEDHLRIALGITEEIRLVPTDTLGLIRVDTTPIDPGDIHTNRSDMKAMRYGIDAAAAGVKMRRAGFLPTLNAFASYELNDDALAGTKGRSWMVGAILKWNIFSGSGNLGELQKAAAKLSSLETEYEKMKVNGSREIESARRSLQTAERGIELATTAVAHAAEALRVRADRYEKGLERTADLLQAESALSNARLRYLQSLYRHTMSVYTLEFLLERKVTQ